MILAFSASCSLGGEADNTEQLNSSANTSSNLFSPLEGRAALLSSEPTIIRSRVVSIDFSLLDASEQLRSASEITSLSVVLNLFDDVSYTAVLNRQETNVAGVITWIGHIDGVEFSEVTISVIDNDLDTVMNGSITLPGGEIYRINFLSESMHAVYQIDQSAFPEE